MLTDAGMADATERSESENRALKDGRNSPFLFLNVFFFFSLQLELCVL